MFLFASAVHDIYGVQTLCVLPPPTGWSVIIRVIPVPQIRELRK